jgi:hypothetical protein
MLLRGLWRNITPKYHNSLVMYSPYTGEEYSANPGDYWAASSSKRFKDHEGRVMRLVVKGSVQYRQLHARKRVAKAKKR